MVDRRSFVQALLAVHATAGSRLVLDGGSDWSAWRTSVDGVMGGKSSIALSVADGSMRATGYLNTDGGGFAGCWRDVGPTVDVSAYAGVAVTYRALDASEPPLALELRLGGAGDSNTWVDHRAVFALAPSSDADGLGTVTLPFEAFVPRCRGSERTGTLDLTAIDEMGLQLLFQEGAFDFTIVEIAAVTELSPSHVDPEPVLGDAPSPTDVVRVIDATISRGVSVYNKGYYSQCDKIYAATSRGLVTSLEGGTGRARSLTDGAGLMEDARDALADAIAEAAAMGYSEDDEIARAWALRHGLDGARASAVSAAETTETTETTESSDSDADEPAAAATETEDEDEDEDEDEPAPADGGDDDDGGKSQNMMLLVGLIVASVIAVVATVGACVVVRRSASRSQPTKVQNLTPQIAVAASVDCVAVCEEKPSSECAPAVCYDV